ncbi:hypothetical protein HMPREF0083_02053 [Aneurinibacillus aneurinilyticus ATCC 12856]|uniref:Uncharacterized protein n=1 Tax=Aneurinibacillus aneurinilyticus ATCC 12856 TaxID=649747 RepID=U1WMS1_ANEAE|nr:hypothetical protein HMPREF0083_02053 [Aneurinibacillus aneurinilyticus ATCC 12856]
MLAASSSPSEGYWEQGLEKDTLAFLLLGRRAHPTSSFFQISYF